MECRVRWLSLSICIPWVILERWMKPFKLPFLSKAGRRADPEWPPCVGWGLPLIWRGTKHKKLLWFIKTFAVLIFPLYTQGSRAARAHPRSESVRAEQDPSQVPSPTAEVLPTLSWHLSKLWLPHQHTTDWVGLKKDNYFSKFWRKGGASRIGCIVNIISGEGNGNPLQYSCLENPMDRGAWWAAVHGVMKSRTRLSDFAFTFHFHALEKEMATHSSVLAWRIPGTGEPGGLLSMGSHRVGHDWSDLAVVVSLL